MVEGDVFFEADVVCKGKVELYNKTSIQQRVAQGTVLDGEKVWE
jgi:hypothetical protein